MKKVLLMFFTVAVMTACIKTPEDRAKDIIGENVKRMLYNPDSYDAVDTKIDSIFTIFGDPSFYEQTLKVYKMGEEIQNLANTAKYKKSTMALNSGPYETAYGRNRYNEAKEEYDEAMAKKEKLEAKVNKAVEELKAQMKAKPQFRGFWAWHRYRAKSNAGVTLFGEVVFVFDTDMSKIVYAYDPDENDYKRVMLLYKLMQGRDIELEKDKWLVDEDIWESIWNM